MGNQKRSRRNSSSFLGGEHGGILQWARRGAKDTEMRYAPCNKRKNTMCKVLSSIAVKVLYIIKTQWKADRRGVRLYCGPVFLGIKTGDMSPFKETYNQEAGIK